MQGAYGVLDANAQATAALAASPTLAPAIGLTTYLAAVTYDTGPLTGRLSSIARDLEIVP